MNSINTAILTLTVSDNIANFIRKLRVLRVQTRSNAVQRSWEHNGYICL
jgi:hypothetical protein